MQNSLFVISGPSGVGKGTLVKALLEEDPTLALSISCTTRAPRAGERHGVEYFFLTREEFDKRRESGDFLEYDEHFGNYYGT
ncbi:MAG: guanylate kinase, partial [Clostridia bacterium]|nr:guanylate kinase [Clostridia bacterium]